MSLGWTDWLSRWLQTPDRLIGWLPEGVVAGVGAVRRHRCQAIYSSAPRWTGHLIALLVKQLTGRHWVADFRDPWRGNPFHQIPYKTLDRFDGWLEAHVIQGADWVICNTEPVRQEFIKRFPDQASKFVVIPNGFEPEDFAEMVPERSVGTDQLVLTHAGAFYGLRRPHPLFQALRLLQDRQELDRKLCLQLVGPPTYDGQRLEALAAEFGVAAAVRVCGAVPHQRSLALMRGSDIQVLVGFNGFGADLQVPGKLYEYFGVGRPILALAPRTSAIAHVLQESGMPGQVCDPDDPEQIARAITALATAAQPWQEKGFAADAPASLLKFTRREQVRRLAELLAGRL